MYYETEYSKRRFAEIDSKMPWIVRRIAHHFSYARSIYIVWIMVGLAFLIFNWLS